MNDETTRVPEPQPSQRPNRLAYYPALDGLRGIGLVGMLFYHSGVNWIPGGCLSISTFFTLSGFLISSLLLYEWQNTGRINLGAFWSRRFRRLMPGALLALAVIAVIGGVAGDASQLGRLRGDGIAALFYVSNWRFIGLGDDYADLFASPSLVQHFWSLSIEEQFYLTYPLLAIALLRRGRRAFGGVVVALTVFSTLSMILLFEPGEPTGRLYFGTDTRIAEILLGAMLALWHVGRPELRGAARRAAVGLGALGLLGTGFFWFGVSADTPWLWQGGFSLYALLTVATMLGAMQTSGPANKVLAWGPLPWFGRVSYGVYIYHFPVYVTLTEQLTGLNPWPLFCLRVAATFALAVPSYYLLELPVRRRRLLTGWGRWIAAPVGAAAAAGALVAVTVDPPKPAVDLAALPNAARFFEGAGPRIMVAGDSIARGIGQGLGRWAKRTGRASVFNVSRRGCGVARGGRLEDRFKSGGDTCDDWPEYWSRILADFEPDIVVMLTGGWDLRDRHLPDWRTPRSLGDEAFDAWMLSELEAAVDMLASQGARVVWLSTPCSKPALFNPVVLSPERVKRLNELVSMVAALSRHDVEVLDLFGHVCPGGEYTNELGGVRDLRPDGAHFSSDGADWLARWLGPRILYGDRAAGLGQ